LALDESTRACHRLTNLLSSRAGTPNNRRSTEISRRSSLVYHAKISTNRRDADALFSARLAIGARMSAVTEERDAGFIDHAMNRQGAPGEEKWNKLEEGGSHGASVPRRLLGRFRRRRCTRRGFVLRGILHRQSLVSLVKGLMLGQ